MFSGVTSQSPMSPPPVDVKSVVVSQSMASYSAAASSSQATTPLQQRVREKPNAPAVPAVPIDYDRTVSPILNSVGSESLISRLSPEVAPIVSTDSSVSSGSLSQDSATVDLIGQSSSFTPVAMTTSILSNISSYPVATVVSHFDVSTTLESLMRTTAQTSRSESPPLLPSYATVSSSVLGPVTSADEQRLSGVLEERMVQAAQQPATGQVALCLQFHWSVGLCFCLCLSLCLCLSVDCLSVHPAIRLFLSVCPAICLFVYLYRCLSVSQALSQSFSLSAGRLSICLSYCLIVRRDCLSVCLTII